MDVRELVVGHYSGADLAGTIIGALAAAGVDVAALSIEDLAAVDQLHAGFAPATAYLLDRLELGPDTRLLDVGCGIGGPSRMAAAKGAGHVTGIDLTPEFVAAAGTLTARVGLAGTVDFVACSADDVPLSDASFDVAMMIHVGMNLPDKRAVFTEVHRLLAPGGRFAIFEQMRTGEGDLPYPLPWAVDELSSFVETAEEYAAHLAAAGFAVEATEDRTAAIAGPPPPGPGGADLNPGVLFGPEFGRRIGNNIAATMAGQLGAILMIGRAE